MMELATGAAASAGAAVIGALWNYFHRAILIYSGRHALTHWQTRQWVGVIRFRR